MASLIIDDVMAKPTAVVALLGLHLRSDEGEHLYGMNIDRGYRVATPCGNRYVDIQGIETDTDHEVELKLTWVERSSPDYKYIDETFPSFEGIQNLAGEVVAFVSRAEWPRYNRKAMKSPKRITKVFNDKPYQSVDVVCPISSSMETMSLYKEFMEREWTYKQDMGSHQHTIAWVNDKPIAVTPWVHVVNGVTVMYVEAQSALIDWDVIEIWIRERVRANTPIVVDPTNLVSHICQISRSKES